MAQLAPVIYECFENGTDVELTPTGGSMRPLWRHRRDVVKLTSVKAEDIKIWDVLLYKRSETEFVLHRVVGVNPDSLDFLGDAQFIVEHNVPKDSVVAVVKGFCRQNGRYRTANDPVYRLYVWVWCNTRGIRYFLHRVVNKIKRMVRRCK